MSVFAVALDNEGYGCGFYIWQAEDEEDLIVKLKAEWNEEPSDEDEECDTVQAWLDEGYLTIKEITEENFNGEQYMEVFENFC